MIGMLIFLTYTVLSIILYIKMETFSLKRMETLLTVLGIPWLWLIGSGTYWGYFGDPYCRYIPITGDNYAGGLAILIGVPASYALVWKWGHRRGYGKSREHEMKIWTELGLRQQRSRYGE